MHDSIENGITTLSPDYLSFLSKNTTIDIVKSIKEVTKKPKVLKKLKKSKKTKKNKFILSSNNTYIKIMDNNLNISSENINKKSNVVLLKNKKSMKKRKDKTGKSTFEGQQILPIYLNATCELYTKEDPCIPPLQNFQSRFRVDLRHKINFCTITKNFSSMLRSILCFIKKPQYIKYQEDLTKGSWTYKFCNDNNFSRRISRVANNYTDGDVDKLMKTWKHVAFVRDPFERFVSGFVDKCVISKEWKIEKNKCYGCRANVTCLLQRLYEKLKEKSSFSTKNKDITYDDIHFFPQSWHCEFNRHMNSYTIIKYGTKPKVLLKFYKTFFKFLRENGIPMRKIKYIRKYTINKRTRHATYNLWVRKYIEKKIRKSKYLMKLIYLIFYYDYIVFNFPLPSIPK
ncbi:Sulfotransferase family-containing protein [Strongyloides ratti]|uniref:Sulfotransferase family-containing protein n=1 Tax=Strongyloides ratti TaxID=34506 RepID=A0A090L341_STRRB|nr:Sulfotransferase family-containing protein [Strongyloides ratti]CEF64132.1 Sulfotransferase family-containing protein [Strongyloides ratti]